MVSTPSKPNPLHGAVKKDDHKEEVHMPGAPPKSDMAPHEAPAGEPATEATKAEMAEGKKALSAVEERTKAEMDAGKAIIAKHPQPKENHRENHKEHNREHHKEDDE